MFYYKKIIKQMGLYFLIFPLICFNFFENCLCADTLNLQSQLSIITKKDKISILLNISNTGPATAYDIVLRINFLGESRESKTIHCLGPNFDEAISMEFDLQKHMKGDYPLIVEIQFHDMNLYPFYSLRCSPIHIHSQKQKRSLNVHVPDIKLSDQNNIGVQIVNLEKLKKQITVQMIVPGAFFCEKNTRIRSLPKGQSVDIEYCILKKEALPDTIHNGYVLITYEDNSIAHALITPFKIYVKPVARVFVYKKNIVAKACVLFGLIWLIFLTFVSFRKSTLN
jgi:hypothetical protein